MNQPDRSSAVADMTFGYIPDAEAIDGAMKYGPFARALVVETPVNALADQVLECRILWDPSVELPEGVYWFGVEGDALVMQVGNGATHGQGAIVPIDELKDDDALARAWRWAEDFWRSAAVVPKPKFEVNQEVVGRPDNRDLVVRARKFLRGEWTYSVRSDGRQLDYLESRLSAQPENDDPVAWVRGEIAEASRFGATLTRAKLLGKFTNTLFSFRATRTTFRPYQFKPVLKLLQSGKARLLIADEVGLGKTIEAGLIWTELEAREEANRVLVVCPSSLIGKWTEEMEERFGFELVELTRSGLDDFARRHLENRLPQRHTYICSLELLRAWKGLDTLKDVPPQFDLVIVDEAHAMRNSDTKSYVLGTELAEWADNMVFLTATPINLREQDLLNLLELLAPEDYSDLNDLEVRLAPNRIINDVSSRLGRKGANGHELVRRLGELKGTSLGAAIIGRPDYPLLVEALSKGSLDEKDVVDARRHLAELNSLSTVITRTKKVDVDDHKAKRTEDRQEIDWAQEEADFYEEYLNWCNARAREAGLPLYFAMQMPLRLASACLPMARRAVLNPASFGQIEDADSDAPKLRLEPHPALVAAARRLPEGVDTKFDQLRIVLDGLHRQGKQAILFSHSVPTLKYLEERLGSRLRVAVMYGAISREERRRILKDFRAGEYDLVIANRVASEGLDFEFCSAVINYDLPWNPMEIEQRIGRIDRIGQKEQSILIVNFVNEATIDERILSRLLDRIRIFEASIGELEPIISELAPKVLQAGFDFTLTAEQREQKQHEILLAHEEQRAGLRDVSDASSALFVADDVEVAGLEDDLLRTGRYIGQRELAALLDDWARVDGASGVKYRRDGDAIELTGNATMASRVDELARRSRRTGAETSTMASSLRAEVPIHLILDQELSRVSGGTLLTATSPLTMAAAGVPGHRQSRFASLKVESLSAEPGEYLIVLARAAFQSAAGRSADEIWGAAVSVTGERAGDEPVDALLAALAQGRLTDRALPEIERLPNLASRAMNKLHMRHLAEQDIRSRQFDALRQARLITLEGQHQRKLQTIERRIATSRARGRGARSIALHQSQLVRAGERYARTVSEIMSNDEPSLQLEPLAACLVLIEAVEGA